jgi:hypothetical protein
MSTMTKPTEEWKVRPHGELTKLADNLFTVEGLLRMPPLGETPRRMTVIRLAGNRLAIHSAISLEDRAMAALEALGEPTYLIVPSALHRLDAMAWKKRYPKLIVIAPRGARDKVNEVVPVDATEMDFADPHLRLSTLPGTADREFSLMVETPTGKTLIINDLIFNLRQGEGLVAWLMHFLGIGADRPRIAKPVAMKLIRDKKAVRSQLEAWATDGLERILVSHGAPIDDPRRTLLELAGALA